MTVWFTNNLKQYIGADSELLQAQHGAVVNAPAE